MSLLRQGKALVLTMYMGESDQWQGKPLYVAIVQLLREELCAGATVSRAIAGYGAGSRLHTQQALHWSSDVPIVLQVIDQPERIRRVLPRVQAMLNGGLLTLHEVEVLKYTHARRRGLPTKLPVAQVMETAITTVQLTTPVAEVLHLLIHAPFRALPVVDEQNHLQGIISTGDLIEAGLLPVRRGVMRTALELDSQTAQTLVAPLTQPGQGTSCAQDVMNRQVRSISTETTLGEAAQIMLETGLKRLPVVDAEQKLRGMLSRTDLLQVIVTSPLMGQEASSATQPLSRSRPLAELPVPQQPVVTYMRSEVATVEEQTPLADVIDALILSPQKRVFVVDAQQRVQGVISDIDVLTRLQAEARPGVLRLLMNWTRGKPGRVPTGALRTSSGNARVATDVMNRDLVTALETASVQETIERMMSTGRTVLPIVDAQGQMRGIVGRSDLLQLLIEEEG